MGGSLATCGLAFLPLFDILAHCISMDLSYFPILCFMGIPLHTDFNKRKNSQINNISVFLWYKHSDIDVKLFDLNKAYQNWNSKRTQSTSNACSIITNSDKQCSKWIQNHILYLMQQFFLLVPSLFSDLICVRSSQIH